MNYLLPIQLIFLFFFLFCNTYGQKSHSLLSKTGKAIIDTIAFGRISNDVRLIGLGEFTHGGSEIINYKAELCKFLIEKHSIKRILFEYMGSKMKCTKR